METVAYDEWETGRRAVTKGRRVRLGVLLFAWAAGCASGPSKPASTAAAVSSPCQDGKAWQDDLQFLQPTSVRSVEPLYLRNTCDGTTQVAGTRLRIRPPDGAVQPDLRRMLGCGARVRLATGITTSAGPTPLWLPDGWIELDVRSEGNDLALTLRAESVPKNIELFHRSSDFARPRSSPPR